MIDVAQLKIDRHQGSKGPITAARDRSHYGTLSDLMAGGKRIAQTIASPPKVQEADCRRFARLDELELAVLKMHNAAQAIEEFMDDLTMRARLDKRNIDEDGVVTLPCGNGVLARLRDAQNDLKGIVE